jgi:3'(2'), 5'-bisphosphate nucleotidase
VFTDHIQEARFARKAVEQAAKLCRQIQVDMVSPAITKADHSPVTVADFASQALVAEMMLEAFPQDPLVAEEDSYTLRNDSDGGTLQQVTGYLTDYYQGVDTEQVCSWIDHGNQKPAERFWTLDPIDGTKGFLRGEQYVTALALIESGQVIVAALGCPNLSRDLEPQVGGVGCVLLAVRQAGSFVFAMGQEGPRRLEVSDLEQPQSARLLRSVESGHTDESKMVALLSALGMTKEPVLMDSQAKYAMLAGGEGDLIFRLVSPSKADYAEKIWDHAAGALIVEEAGGRVSDLRGLPLDFRQGRTLKENVGVLASNSALHEIALACLSEVGADRRPEKT